MNQWVFIGFLLVAVGLTAWAWWSDFQRLRYVKAGAVWKKIYGSQRVTILSVNHSEELVHFSAGGLIVYAMSFGAFLALYELESIPFKAVQKTIELGHCAVIPPKKDTLS